MYSRGRAEVMDERQMVRESEKSVPAQWHNDDDYHNDDVYIYYGFNNLSMY